MKMSREEKMQEELLKEEERKDERKRKILYPFGEGGDS